MILSFLSRMLARGDRDEPSKDSNIRDDLEILRCLNVTKGTIVCEEVVWATGAARKRGLLDRRHLDPTEGMYIVPTQWIHMFGMRFPIDVAFLDRQGRVLATHSNLRPNRLSRIVPGAEGALELAVGALRASCTTVGDTIELLDAREMADRSG
jgi:uncharacterized membrane protein (UPF0127 family)